MKRDKKYYKRTVRLGVYGDIAEKIITAVQDISKKYYFGTPAIRESFAACEVSRSEDNEIVFDVFEEDSYFHPLKNTIFALSGSKQKNDSDIRKWLADCIKGVAKIKLGCFEHEKNINQAKILKINDWHRNCNKTINIHINKEYCFNVSQIYALYDALKGRKLNPLNYLDNIIAQVVGKPFDPVRTEIETFRREEINRIETEFQNALHEISAWRSLEQSKLIIEYENKIKAANVSKDEKLKALNNEIDTSLNGLNTTLSTDNVECNVQSEVA